MKKNKSAEEEAIVEAVLFTMGKSVETRQLAAALRADMDTAREAALRLKKRYDRGKHGMQITRLEDSWQMCTRAEYSENLIYEVGRLDAPGRPALFATTEEFLRRFGVGSTKELPVPAQDKLDEFRLEAEEELKLAAGEERELSEDAGESMSII